ncbi:MAG: diguanylate cyclase, partial [Burkholderiaceae bacterium]|nr:diguanylate cyclase [Burkholderiaceae bacterium]
FIEEGADFNQLLTQADQAVQAAKNLGRNRLEVAAAASEAALQASRSPRLPLEDLAAARPAAASRVGHDHDPLTQLPHRRYFDARLAREFSTARKHGRALSLALIDIQQMHLLNRRYGFAAGDRILQGVAEATRRSVRLVDWVARIGGNQFAVVMPDTDLSGAAPVLARLQGKLQQAPLSGLDGAPLPVSTRLVLRQMDAETLSAEQWLLETLAALRAGVAGTPA